MNYIGIDIGGTNLKAGLVDEDGLLLAVKTMKIREVSDPDALTDTLVALTGNWPRRAACPWRRSPPWGRASREWWTSAPGPSYTPATCPLRNIPLRKLFKRRLGLHLYVENDANCAALAEYHAGAGQGSKRFVTITLGTGIGAGIIHNGKKFSTAATAWPVRWATCIDYQGSPCPCGRRGCWEQYASASALKRFTAQAQLGNPDSILAGSSGSMTAMCPASRRLWPPGWGPGGPAGLRHVCGLSGGGHRQRGEYFPAGYPGHRRRRQQRVR